MNCVALYPDARAVQEKMLISRRWTQMNADQI